MKPPTPQHSFDAFGTNHTHSNTSPANNTSQPDFFNGFGNTPAAGNVNGFGNFTQSTPPNNNTNSNGFFDAFPNTNPPVNTNVNNHPAAAFDPFGNHSTANQHTTTDNFPSFANFPAVLPTNNTTAVPMPFINVNPNTNTVAPVVPVAQVIVPVVKNFNAFDDLVVNHPPATVQQPQQHNPFDQHQQHHQGHGQAGYGQQPQQQPFGFPSQQQQQQQPPQQGYPHNPPPIVHGFPQTQPVHGFPQQTGPLPGYLPHSQQVPYNPNVPQPQFPSYPPQQPTNQAYPPQFPPHQQQTQAQPPYQQPQQQYPPVNNGFPSQQPPQQGYGQQQGYTQPGYPQQQQPGFPQQQQSGYPPQQQQQQQQQPQPPAEPELFSDMTSLGWGNLSKPAPALTVKANVVPLTNAYPSIPTHSNTQSQQQPHQLQQPVHITSVPVPTSVVEDDFFGFSAQPQQITQQPVIAHQFQSQPPVQPPVHPLTVQPLTVFPQATPNAFPQASVNQFPTAVPIIPQTSNDHFAAFPIQGTTNNNSFPPVINTFPPVTPAYPPATPVYPQQSFQTQPSPINNIYSNTNTNPFDIPQSQPIPINNNPFQQSIAPPVPNYPPQQQSYQPQQQQPQYPPQYPPQVSPQQPPQHPPVTGGNPFDMF